MEKTMYIASVMEVDGDGDVFTSLYAEDTVHQLFQDVKKHLQTEIDERSLDMNIDEQRLLEELHGNEMTGPMLVEPTDWDTAFYISAMKVTKEVTLKAYMVMTTYSDDGQSNDTYCRVSATPEGARKLLEESFAQSFSEGHVNSHELPGIFHDTPRQNIRVTRTPNSIFATDGTDSFFGKIIDTEIK